MNRIAVRCSRKIQRLEYQPGLIRPLPQKLPVSATDALSIKFRWFSDPLAMINDDEIDVITISVKVPAHRELVLAALSAGKAVYCEAPLGRTVAEAEEMANAVGSLHTAIGLQGRLNPAVRRAAELLSSGKIGRPLNARIVSATSGFGPVIHSSHYLFQVEVLLV